MRRIVIAVICLVFTPSSWAAVSPKDAADNELRDRVDFVDKLTIRIKDNTERADLRDKCANVRTDLTDVRKSPTPQSVDHLEQKALDLAEQVDLWCKVKVTTKAAGATVKYQRCDGKGDPTGIELTGEKPTQCSLNLKMGQYVIWTERTGKSTSKRNRYPIYMDETEISIPED